MSDLFSLNGKHILVTGGSSGLGRFFAVFLAARGAQVTVAARRAEALAKTVNDIETANGRAQAQRLHHQYRLDSRSAGCQFRRTVCDLESRRCADDQSAGA